MQVSPKTEVTVTLSISAREAKLLMGIVQNPMCEPHEEDREMREFRYDLFNAIKKALGQ